jgi:glutathione S-transferase
MPTLICLPYSPWSERAAWALDRRGIAYDKEVYEPVLGELRLRRLRGGAPGPTSVPVLVTDDRVIADSGAIARWADGRGSGPRLFPDEAAVAAWEAVAEQATAAGRARSLRRVLADPDAVMDLVPKALRPLGPIARGIAATGVRRTLRKYGATGTADDAHRAALVAALERLRDGLAAGSGTPKTLLGAFSYADITAAQALVFVSPPEPPADGAPRPGIRIGRASRRAFRDPELAVAYADLVAWRDALYAEYRVTA